MFRTFLLACSFLLLLVNAEQAYSQQASSKTYLKIMEVQELWDAENYAGALAVLQEHSNNVGRDPYDQAVIQQYIGHTHVFMDRIDLARGALEKAIALPGLNIELQADLHVMYGQIVLGDEEYRIAADSLEFWYANTTTERQPAVIFSLGYANYMIENLPRAEEVIYEAIGLSAEPKESWYRLYYQILFDQRKFAAAEDVLLGMITRNPLKSAHWRLLANHHLQLEDGQKALAAIAIAYQNGWLESEQDLRRMIALYSVIDVPEKAARLMETHLADASIEKDADTLKRLGNLWLLAREREKAKGVLEEAADVSPDGRTYEMLGNIYFEDESWRDAHQAFINAIDSGGLDDVERVYLLAGISAERGGMKKEARAALRKARESEDLRKQADALLKRLDSS